jgi:hypothetical protein
LVVLGGIAATLFQGYHVGAHVWLRGWLCGHTNYNGSPFCIPDPRDRMSQ